MRISLLTACTASIVFSPAAIHAQQKTPAAEAAERMSGTWTINLNLSPSFKPSGRGGRGSGVAYTVGGFVPQRGRGNGTSPGSEPTPSAAGDLTPAERAEQTAMHLIEQIAPTITVKATADTFSIVDPRGEQTCAINDKSAKLEMFGAKVTAKCRWTKLALQQEYSTTKSKLTRTWSLDEAGHLVVNTRVDGQGQRTLEAAAVYDRSAS
jgi:hypothetical protein